MTTGAGIMEAEDHQVMTVFTVQLSFHHRHLTTHIMKHCHHRRTCSHTSPRCSTMMVTLHDTCFVECQWWNTVKTVVTWQLLASMILAPGLVSYYTRRLQAVWQQQECWHSNAQPLPPPLCWPSPPSSSISLSPAMAVAHEDYYLPQTASCKL